MNLNSPKYYQQPNIVSHECVLITEKVSLLEISCPQMWLCLFTLQYFAVKRIKSLLLEKHSVGTSGIVSVSDTRCPGFKFS